MASLLSAVNLGDCPYAPLHSVTSVPALSRSVCRTVNDEGNRTI